MEKLILKSGAEIEIMEGASIEAIATDVPDFDSIEYLSEILTPENLCEIIFSSDNTVSGVYRNMILKEPHFIVTLRPDGSAQVIFGLRERTAAELQQEATQTAIAYLTDEQALTVSSLYPEWSPKKEYTVGERYRHGDTLYKCLQDHQGQADWTPEAAPSLWARVSIPIPSEVPDWVQPDSTNPYSVGDRVRHSGDIWESIVDGNVWEPGTEGTDSLWKLIR